MQIPLPGDMRTNNCWGEKIKNLFAQILLGIFYALMFLRVQNILYLIMQLTGNFTTQNSKTHVFRAFFSRVQIFCVQLKKKLQWGFVIVRNVMHFSRMMNSDDNGGCIVIKHLNGI